MIIYDPDGKRKQDEQFDRWFRESFEHPQPNFLDQVEALRRFEEESRKVEIKVGEQA